MEQQTQPTPTYQNPAELPPKESVLLGTIGALLFSLAGAVVFFLLHLANFVAGLSGLVAIATAYFGYGLFSGNKASRKGLIIAAVAAVLSMLVANYFAFAYDFLQELKDAGGTQSFGFALSKAPELLRGNPVHVGCGTQIWTFTLDNSAFIKDVLVSLLFALIGAVGFFRTTLAGAKQHD